MQKIDFIASNKAHKIIDSQLYMNKLCIHTGFYCKGQNDELSPAMKKFISEAKNGEMLAFDIYCMNEQGKMITIDLNVKIVE